MCYTSLGVSQRNMCYALVIQGYPTSVTSVTGLQPFDITPLGTPSHLIHNLFLLSGTTNVAPLSTKIPHAVTDTTYLAMEACF